MENYIDKKSIIIFGLNRLFKNENRILNEYTCLIKIFNIFLIGFYEVNNYDKLQLTKLLREGFRFFFRISPFFSLKIYQYFLNEKFPNSSNLIICHHIDEALICDKKNIKFVFHSNEYLPKEFDGSFKFRIFEQAYRKITLNYILPKAQLIVVEGERIAKEYSKNFGVPLSKFFIATNAPMLRPNLNPKYPSSPIKLIHHGAIVKERGPEFLFEIFKELGSGYSLTLMGPGKDSYIQQLKMLAQKIGNIEIKPPVPYENIVETVSQYDLGLIIFQSKHFHHKYMTVPNKFYECLQARVPVIVSPTSAMAPIILKNQCGIVSKSDSLDDYVDAIKSLSSERIYEMSNNCNNLAFEHSNEFWFEDYRKTISDIINQEPTSSKI